jgi:hypothetical protein
MESDIVERLRGVLHGYAIIAAEEIERLRAELADANARIAELEAMQPQPTLSRSLQLEQAQRHDVKEGGGA